MRSRYSAYALGNASYIMDTTHPKSPLFQENRETWEQDILLFSKHTSFIGLKILDTDERGNEATVTFLAVLEQEGKDVSFTEKSLFYKEGKRWLYHSGIIE